jgi:hypothetical protein
LRTANLAVRKYTLEESGQASVYGKGDLRGLDQTPGSGCEFSDNDYECSEVLAPKTQRIKRAFPVVTLLPSVVS